MPTLRFLCSVSWEPKPSKYIDEAREKHTLPPARPLAQPARLPTAGSTSSLPPLELPQQPRHGPYFDPSWAAAGRRPGSSSTSSPDRRGRIQQPSDRFSTISSKHRSGVPPSYTTTWNPSYTTSWTSTFTGSPHEPTSDATPPGTAHGPLERPQPAGTELYHRTVRDMSRPNHRLGGGSTKDLTKEIVLGGPKGTERKSKRLDR